MREKYKLGLEIRGVFLFLFIMLSNVVWFMIPAPNDVLRAESVTPGLDKVATVFQVLMITLLCGVISKVERTKRASKWRATCLVCCVLYYISWIFYYQGVTHMAVIGGLTLPPCMAFFCFAKERKHDLALGATVVFTFCHMIYAIKNFM